MHLETTWDTPDYTRDHVMSVDVRPVVLVHRPRAEVATFMFEPRNDLRWTGGITSSSPAQPGPLVQGASVERSVSFLGPTFHVRVRRDPAPGRPAGRAATARSIAATEGLRGVAAYGA